MISSTGRCFPALSNRFQGEMHGNVVSKDPSGILVVEIAVNDSPKAVSTRQKQLDMTQGAAGTARISSTINFTRSHHRHNTGLVTVAPKPSAFVV